MQREFPKHAAERALLLVFLAWLIWLPMPFGSVIERAWLPLIAVPLVLCALAALVAHLPDVRAWRIWSLGAIALLAVIALQLVPLPLPLLRALSPQSAELWAGSDRVLGIQASAHPIAVAPPVTFREWFRMLALFATFQTAALLVTTHWRRLALAAALIAAATFEFLYGVNEAALRRYEIWGWKNRLIFNRVTGTFVNPNHFSHYLAIILPLALFVAVWAWHHAAPGATFGRRVAKLIEKNSIPFGGGILGALGCLAGILVGQSRGALLALFSGLAIVGVLASRRRRLLFALSGIAASLLILGALVIYLGRERTIQRFTPNEGETVTLVGRTVGAKIALGVWKRFPIFGSGAGSFPNVSSMAQTDNLGNLFNHAHDDYLELAATTGTLGFAIAVFALFAGWWSLARITFGDEADGSFRRRAFQAAALASLTIAMVHALFDFNFFVPSNPATLAAIAGAAVAAYQRSFDPDASLNRVSRRRIRNPDVDPMETA